MKLLAVAVICFSVYCVRGYTIFPLPGQSVAVNPKFGRLDTRPLSGAQSVTATNIVPFLSTLSPLPSTSYQTSKVPVVSNLPTTSTPKPLVANAPEVRISPTLSTVSSYASTLEALKKSSFVPNVQTPPGTTNFLPKYKSFVPETKPETLKPIKPEIEAPARDLLPPKLR